jgi:hypothetical protein
MPATAHPTREATLTIGALCVGGDWACAHGDLSALRHVAECLADYVDEPLHCELMELADACYCDPDRACASWSRVKEHVYRTARA